MRRRISSTICVVASGLLACSAPSCAVGGDGKFLRAVAAGPFVLLLALAAAAVFTITVSAVQRHNGLIALLAAASRRMDGRTVLYTVWGVLGEVLLVSLAALLSKRIGLLAVIVVLTAIGILGFGAVVAAVSAGRRLRLALPDAETATTTGALATGLALFFVAVAFPVAGWIVVGLSALTGAGALFAAVAQGGTGESFEWP